MADAEPKPSHRERVCEAVELSLMRIERIMIYKYFEQAEGQLVLAAEWYAENGELFFKHVARCARSMVPGHPTGTVPEFECVKISIDACVAALVQNDVPVDQLRCRQQVTVVHRHP